MDPHRGGIRQGIFGKGLTATYIRRCMGVHVGVHGCRRQIGPCLVLLPWDPRALLLQQANQSNGVDPGGGRGEHTQRVDLAFAFTLIILLLDAGGTRVVTDAGPVRPSSAPAPAPR